MSKKVLCLFDVDGTLTRPRRNIEPEMDEFLKTSIKPIAKIGLVGGSDFKKIAEQMNGDDVIHRFDYVFPENGLVMYKHGTEGPRQSIQDHLGEENLQKFINFCLNYLSNVNIPVKRGTFIEFRSGLINVSPIGRACTQSERDAFEEYDKKNQIRKKMIKALKVHFSNVDLTYSIGGQISFDVFPHGWDKTYCLKHLEDEGFEEIHFFGDKTYEGGNDYEIFNHPSTIGHSVKNPDETMKLLKEIFNL